MPANVVKDSGDERHWRKAKELAAQQGRAGDYGYIMGIFQKMTGKKSLSKSFMVPAAWRGSRIPGQVPGQGGRNLERLLDMPKSRGGLAMLEHTEPRLTPESVVKGLGMDLATEADWRGWLSKNLASAPNEVVVRKALYTKFLDEKTPPELRRALFQRAMMYYGGLRKSVVEVVTPDELLEKARSVTPVGGVTPGGYKKVKEGQYQKVSLTEDREHHGGVHHLKTQPKRPQMELRADTLAKAEARGGAYHRRVKTEKGYRYYYDPDKYNEREDAHTDGEGALKKRLVKMCVANAQKAGEAGCGMEAFKTLAARFGADKVAEALRTASAEGGPLEFNKGYFRMRQALQKSDRFIITR